MLKAVAILLQMVGSYRHSDDVQHFGRASVLSHIIDTATGNYVERRRKP